MLVDWQNICYFSSQNAKFSLYTVIVPTKQDFWRHLLELYLLKWIISGIFLMVIICNSTYNYICRTGNNLWSFLMTPKNKSVILSLAFKKWNCEFALGEKMNTPQRMYLLNIIFTLCRLVSWHGSHAMLWRKQTHVSAVEIWIWAVVITDWICCLLLKE